MKPILINKAADT